MQQSMDQQPLYFLPECRAIENALCFRLIEIDEDLSIDRGFSLIFKRDHIRCPVVLEIFRVQDNRPPVIHEHDVDGGRRDRLCAHDGTNNAFSLLDGKPKAGMSIRDDDLHLISFLIWLDVDDDAVNSAGAFL